MHIFALFLPRFIMLFLSLVNDHLDHLNDLSAAQPKHPASLNTLISEMSKIRKSLHLLVPKEDLGDCILAHKMSNMLDRPTREAWETSRVSTKELPKYEDFEAFLVSRVRALEVASDAPSSPPKQSAAHSKPLKAYHTTSPTTGQSSQQDSRKVTHSPRITQHPCSYCGEPHYIVACPEFKRLNLQERRKFVMEKPLCYNCLGLHSAKNCKSKYKCKTCNGNHHTMIHIARYPDSKPQGTSGQQPAQQ